MSPRPPDLQLLISFHITYGPPALKICRHFHCTNVYYIKTYLKNVRWQLVIMICEHVQVILGDT